VSSAVEVLTSCFNCDDGSSGMPAEASLVTALGRSLFQHAECSVCGTK
jgi:hypothetical protein